jgi:predicted phosphodiesterase
MAKRLDGREAGTDTVDTDAKSAIRNKKAEGVVPGLARRVVSAAPRGDAVVKIFVQPDMHCPYQDKRAVELILRVLERVKPEVAVVLGDHFDFYAVSDHQKDLQRRMSMEWEIAEGDKVLKAYDQLGVFKRKIFCEGNHEWRLTRYVSNKAEEVYRTLAPAGLLQTRTLPETLEFKRRGWEWLPYKDYGRIGRFHFTHDVEKAGKTAHESAQADFETSTAIGHTHQLRLMVRGNYHGQWHTGAMFGWLGDWRAIDYRHKMKIKREWPLGFGMVYVEKTTDIAHIQPILIHAEHRRYRCVVEGKLYTA